MIRILVIDDNIQKQGIIVNAIYDAIGVRDDVEIRTASYIIDAKAILAKTNINIMILDICLPMRPGSELLKDGGIRLLKDIKGSERYTYPRYVIALSEYETLTKEFTLEAGIIHTSIYYYPNSNEWKIRLSESIKTAISILTTNIIKRSYDFDIAVICALPEELDYILQGLKNVQDIKFPDDDYIYFFGYFEKDDKRIRIVATQSTHKGMVPAATLTTRLIYNFAPRYVVMTGIAAGVKGKVNLGDVVAAEYVWDYGAGKETVDGEQAIHRNTIQQITLDPKLANMIRRLSQDSRGLSEIKNDFKGTKPDFELRLHLGAVACGASVIANANKVQEIQNQIRDVIAIEMEIYGVYYAAQWAVSPAPNYIALKSICDYADAEKDDDYHYYSSYTSAKIFEKLAKEYFIYDE